MASIAQYYAEVGVGLDRGSLRSVQAYLKNIERYFTNFQRRIQRNQALSLRVKIDTPALQKNLQVSARLAARNVVVPITRFSVNQAGMSRAFSKAALNINQSLGSMGTKVDRASMLQALQNGLDRVSKSLVLTIRKFKINESGLAKALNASFKKPSFTNRMQISVRISPASLSGMRTQVRQALEGLTIRPRISPRYQQGGSGGRYVGGSSGSDDWVRRSDPRSRRQSPYHNPMMLGGAIGAGVRYGAFALPLVGGVMGLNALSNTLHEFRAQETGLEFAAGMVSDPSKDVDYYRKYLRYVGDVTGQRESNLSRDFHQMLAGSAGTEMEPHLEEGFLGLTQYASILGLSDENMRLVMRGGFTPHVVATLQ